MIRSFTVVNGESEIINVDIFCFVSVLSCDEESEAADISLSVSKQAGFVHIGWAFLRDSVLDGDLPHVLVAVLLDIVYQASHKFSLLNLLVEHDDHVARLAVAGAVHPLLVFGECLHVAVAELGPELVNDSLLVGRPPGHGGVLNVSHGWLHVRPAKEDVIGAEEAVLAEAGVVLLWPAVDQVRGLREERVQLAEGQEVLCDDSEALLDLEDESLDRALALGKVRCPETEFDISVGRKVLDLLLVEVPDSPGDDPVRPDNLPAQVSMVPGQGIIPRLVLYEDGEEVVSGVGLGQVNPTEYGG